MAEKNINQGLNALGSLDEIERIAANAKMGESFSKENKIEKRIAKLVLRIPEPIHTALSSAIENNKYTGSKNTYIVESLRKQLIKDDFLE